MKSQGEANIRLVHGNHVINGQDADTDVLVATSKTYLLALSKLKFGVAKSRVQSSGTT